MTLPIPLAVSPFHHGPLPRNPFLAGTAHRDERALVVPRHVRGKIIEKTPSRSKPDIGSFRTETTVTNQDDVPVMRFTSIVLIRRRGD